MFSFATRLSPRLQSTLLHSTRALESRLSFTTLQGRMAQPTPTSQVISETAKQEGGPENLGATKDSSNAGAGGVNPAHQSAQTKIHNYEQAASEVGSKMQNAPGSVTEADAAYLHSREARASGQANPPPGSLSAQVILQLPH